PVSGPKKAVTETDPPPKPPEAIPTEPPSGKSAEPSPGKAAPPARREVPPGSQVVCGLNFKQMSAADDLKDMQTFGWRNGRKEAEAYDYVAEAGAAYPLDA